MKIKNYCGLFFFHRLRLGLKYKLLLEPRGLIDIGASQFLTREVMTLSVCVLLV